MGDGADAALDAGPTAAAEVSPEVKALHKLIVSRRAPGSDAVGPQTHARSHRPGI